MKSVFISNLSHAFAQTDGSYAFPNSLEGDLLKRAKVEIEFHQAGIEKLRREIMDANKAYQEACRVPWTNERAATLERLRVLKTAFAFVTGTAVNGAEFNALLGDAL